MRKAIFAAALGLGLAALVAPGRAYALGEERLSVHVPFTFDVNGHNLPAGDYVVQQADASQPNVLKLTARNGAPSVFFMTVNGSAPDVNSQPELVFNRYGKQDFLHAVRTPDRPAQVLEASRAERQAARLEVRSEHRLEASPASSR
jgi:hypothetical protein